MNISVSLKNSFRDHNINIQTDGISKRMDIPYKTNGFGSAISGGEILLLAIATCACNDLYREAVRKNINLSSLEVFVNGDFLKEGEPGENITYKVNATAENIKHEDIENLINEVDRIAEIHNTIRAGTKVRLIK